MSAESLPTPEPPDVVEERHLRLVQEAVAEERRRLIRGLTVPLVVLGVSNLVLIVCYALALLGVITLAP